MMCHPPPGLTNDRGSSGTATTVGVSVWGHRDGGDSCPGRPEIPAAICYGQVLLTNLQSSRAAFFVTAVRKLQKLKLAASRWL